MPELSPAERSLRGQIAAHTSWANTTDRPARTAKARRALEDKWLTEAGGDPVKAEHLRRAHYARMALKSSRVRRRRAGLVDEVAASEMTRKAVVDERIAELDSAGR
jgi:hypothetical protein